jgi:NDP-sugar pyrophosphorylase family protein
LLAAVADAQGAGLPKGREFQIGKVVQAAIEAGLVVRGHAFPEGNYVDIGTPAELERIRRLPHL